MKQWRARLTFMAGFLVIGAAALVLSSCGGGGGGSDNPPAAGGGIQNATQAGAAAGAGTAGATAGAGLSGMTGNLGGIGGGVNPGKSTNPLIAKNSRMAKMVAGTQKLAKSKAIGKAVGHLKTAGVKSKAALVAVDLGSFTEDCTDGGTTTYSATIDDVTGAFDFGMNLSSCREEGTQTDGPMSFSGTINLTTFDITSIDAMTIGNPDTDTLLVYKEYTDASYANLEGVYNDGLTIVYDNTTPSNGLLAVDVSSTDSFTMHGISSYKDYSVTPAATTDLTINELSILSIFTQDTAAGITTFDDTITSGGVVQSWTETVDNVTTPHSVAIGFADFNSLVVEDAGSGGLAAPTALSHDATGSYTFSYSGTISVDFTPNSDCEVEGTFTFVTDTPIHQGLGDSCPVAGQFTINGNTTIVYNSDGSVDVTLEGSDPVHFDTCDEVTGLCDVQDLEASGGEAAGDDGTSVSGDGFLVTASWKDDTFDQSDMDLHVGYYGDSSPSSGPADALVSWHSSGTGCEDDHTPIAFGTAFALLDFDDCDGIGPEHVTMDGLSAGYYVIAVNSYALHGSFSAEVNVGVTIGETVYTFDPHTFTTEDFDGTDSDAWYRVVDLKCPTEGICTFESPDLTLQVHDQAGIDGGYLFKTKKK